jgi:uncharacterized cupredoxin-like copper-binding protein
MKRTLVLAFVGLFILAGCASGPSKSIRVIMTDFAFTPNTFTVPAGEPISIELTNNGAATHTFIIMKAGVQVQGHFTDADKANVFWEEPAVAPGQSVKATFNAPSDPGQYQVLCGVPAHFESGMVATLIVVKSP